MKKTANFDETDLKRKNIFLKNIIANVNDKSLKHAFRSEISGLGDCYIAMAVEEMW